MSCVTRRTTRDDFETLKAILLRRGEHDLARLNAAYARMRATQDVPLEHESFLIHCGYPSLADAANLATLMCRRNGAPDWTPYAEALLTSRVPLVDAYYATLFGAWLAVHGASATDPALRSLGEDTASALLRVAWTHAPTHRIRASELADAVKGEIDFGGRWRTGGADEVDGKSVRDLCDGLSYAGEPVFDALERLRERRFSTHEERCRAEMREESTGGCNRLHPRGRGGAA